MVIQNKLLGFDMFKCKSTYLVYLCLVTGVQSVQEMERIANAGALHLLPGLLLARDHGEKEQPRYNHQVAVPIKERSKSKEILFDLIEKHLVAT